MDRGSTGVGVGVHVHRYTRLCGVKDGRMGQHGTAVDWWVYGVFL